MSVTNENARVSYEITGSLSYPVPYYFENSSHLKIYLGDSLLSLGFTVTGAGSEMGGTVTFDEALPPGTLTILREVPITQENSYNDGGPLDAATYEAMFDKLTYLIQQISEKAHRALKLPVHSEISSQFTGNIVPHALLKMNGDGTAFELGLSVDAYASQLQAFVDQAELVLSDTDQLKSEVIVLKGEIEDLLLAAEQARNDAIQAKIDAENALSGLQSDMTQAENNIAKLQASSSMGDPLIDGSWRFFNDAGTLKLQCRVSGSWTNLNEYTI